jgi:thiol-disulfide isomerase/thioredoxin
MKTVEAHISELLVGDAAPPLAVQEFLKGEPVFELAPGKVYVVELWATWCGPSIGCFANLTKLQKQYAQVTVIGVAVKDPDLDRVRAAVVRESNNIGYRIAIEQVREPGAGREGGEMAQRWFNASHCFALPEAFIVDGTGTIAWMGHPGQLDEPLSKVVEGKWDIGAAAAEHRDALIRGKLRERSRIYRELEAPYWAKESAAAVGIIDEAIAADPDLELEFGIYKLKMLMQDREGNKVAVLNHAKRMMSIVAAKAEPSRKWSEMTGIAIALSQFDSGDAKDDPTLADPDLGAIAVQAMQLAGAAPYDQEKGALNAYTRLLHEAFFVHALMANGQMRSARERGARALCDGETEVEGMDSQHATLAAAMRRLLDTMRSRIEQCKTLENERTG